jgi:hypothetical protein
MNDIQEIYAELIDQYPELTKVLDEPRDKICGTWWLDCGHTTVVYYPNRKQRFEVAACPPHCGSENHAFEYHLDIFLDTKEEVLSKVKDLIDNKKYTHEPSKFLDENSLFR